MSNLSRYARTIVEGLVSDVDGIVIEEKETEKGLFIEIKVSKDDVGKVIGKGGRIAESIRNIVRASGARSNQRVLVNVFNKPKW